MTSGPDYLDETHQRIAEFADDYLEEEERGEFVDGLLERLGYQRSQSWAPPDPQQQQGQGRKPLLQQRRQQPRGGGQRGGQRQGSGQRQAGGQTGSYFGR